MPEHARVLPPKRASLARHRKPEADPSSIEPQTPDRPAKTVTAKKRRKRSARSSGTRLQIEDYQLLVEGYRRHPGDHTKAAKLAKVSTTTAQRVWFYGMGAAYEFGQRPLKDIITEEQTLARAELQRRIDAETAAAEDRARRAQDPTGLARQDLPASTAEAARKDAITARAAEAALVRTCRGNAAALAGVVAKLVRGALKQAAKLEQQLTDEKLEIKDGVLVMKRITEMARTTAQAGDLALEMERKLLGDSDGVPDESTMTAEQAIAEIRSASDALERAEAMGFTVHEGGKSVHKPGQLPSWDDAPGGPGAADDEPAVPEYDFLEGEELGGGADALPELTGSAADPGNVELPVDSDEAW